MNLACEGKFKGLGVSLRVHAYDGFKLFVGTSDYIAHFMVTQNGQKHVKIVSNKHLGQNQPALKWGFIFVHYNL